MREGKRRIREVQNIGLNMVDNVTKTTFGVTCKVEIRSLNNGEVMEHQPGYCAERKDIKTKTVMKNGGSFKRIKEIKERIYEGAH